MATLEDVARRAGVSVMTVSRVLNHSDKVKAKTRALVTAAIEDLHYFPNTVARSLATNRTCSIGLVISHIENPIYSEFVSSIISYSNQTPYHIIMCSAECRQDLITGVQVLLGLQVDGFLFFPTEVLDAGDQLEKTIHNMVTAQGKPAVYINKSPDLPDANHIQIDYRGGAKMAVDYLVSLGHREIGYGGRPPAILSPGLWQDRYEGYSEAMLEAGLAVNDNYMVFCLDDISDARDRFGFYLSDAARLPTAFYCANDQIAVGALQAMNALGISVPQRISVMGHDGGLYCRVAYPLLSSVSIEARQVGIEAFILLMDLMENRVPPFGNSRIVRPRLAIQNSTSKLF